MIDRFEASADAAAVSFSWETAEGKRIEWAQALVLRDGQIVHIQDFSDPEKAFRSIRR